MADMIEIPVLKVKSDRRLCGFSTAKQQRPATYEDGNESKDNSAA